MYLLIQSSFILSVALYNYEYELDDLNDSRVETVGARCGGHAFAFRLDQFGNGTFLNWFWCRCST